jgi:putative oxidoreductase
MNIALWAVQGGLALAFLFAGVSKASQSLDSLAKNMGWVRAVPLPFVRFIGVAEFLGAIGLILPQVTGILPWLTPTAAAGLVLVQASAAVFHLSRREVRYLPVNLVLLALAAFVAYGRWAVVPA